MPNNIPFRVYSFRNLGTKGVPIYLGKANEEYFKHMIQRCQEVHIFAKIVGSRHVEVTKPTLENPYVILRTHDYSVNNVLSSIESESTINRIIKLSTLITDSSVVITEDDNSDYQANTWEYDMQNYHNINGFFYKRIGIPSKTDSVFIMKDIVGGNNVSVSTFDGDGDGYDDTILIKRSSPINCYTEESDGDKEHTALLIDRWKPPIEL